MPRDSSPGDASTASMLERIRTTEVRGIEPTPPKTHMFEWSPLALGWYESLLWGFIFVSERHVSKGLGHSPSLPDFSTPLLILTTTQPRNRRCVERYRGETIQGARDCTGRAEPASAARRCGCNWEQPSGTVGKRDDRSKGNRGTGDAAIEAAEQRLWEACGGVD